MTDAKAVPVDAAGVGGTSLLAATAGAVTCWYSEGATAPGADTVAGSTKDDMLAFHRVVQAFFKDGAVVPFRFPTMLADVSALSAWLQTNAAAIARELQRLAGMVQMELHVTSTPAAPAGGGREYLEARRDAQTALRETAAAARATVATLVAEWHERETREGMRCYALLARGNEREFEERLRNASGLAHAAALRITGPWPPAEFLAPSLTTPA